MTDYRPVRETLNFNSSNCISNDDGSIRAELCVRIPIVDDNDVEDNETFSVTVALLPRESGLNFIIQTQSPATVLIKDDDGVWDIHVYYKVAKHNYIIFLV